MISMQAGGKAGKDSGKAKAKAVSRSQRAGLQVNLSVCVCVCVSITGFPLLDLNHCHLCLPSVPSGSNPQALEDSHNQPRPRRSHGGRVQRSYPGVPHRRSKDTHTVREVTGFHCVVTATCLFPGTRVGGKCLQRFEGEAYHPAPLAARYSWRRGVGLSYQGNDCWRRRVDSFATSLLFY